MSISGLFALRCPPPIPCLLLCFRSPAGIEQPFPAPGRSPVRWPVPYAALLYKETFGSPKFPSYPFEHMPWSKTPVVTPALAISCRGLLPSVKSRTSAFSGTQHAECLIILTDHNYTFFGAQYRAYTLVPSSFVLPLPGLHVNFSTEPVANLYSGGTFTHWVTTSSFIPIYVDSQGFGLTLARGLFCYAINFFAVCNLTSTPLAYILHLQTAIYLRKYYHPLYTILGLHFFQFL